MQLLFEEKSAAQLGYVGLPELRYIRERCTLNLTKLTRYYRGSVKHTRSNHILVRLLASLAVVYNGDDENYIYAVASRVGHISASLHLASSYYGKNRLTNYFYGGTDLIKSEDAPNAFGEHIVLHREEFDLGWAKANWEDLEPVKVLRHGVSDIEPVVPDGIPFCINPGIAVIAINVPMLALQWQYWKRRELKKDPGTRKTVAHFAYQYPMVNMMRSHMDVAYFNKIYFGVLGEDRPNAVVSRKQTIAMSPTDTFVDKIVAKQVEYLTSRRTMHYDSLLATIPMIFSDSLWEVARWPEMLNNRQVTWALFVSQLPYLGFLASTAYLREDVSNGPFNNKIIINMQRLNSSRSLLYNYSKAREQYWLAEMNDRVLVYIE